MTRINANIEPKCLMDQHLMAEYRELPMVFAALKRSLKTRKIEDIVKGIPREFTLNKGHVTFFYNKLVFLQNRYLRLVEELKERNFNLDASRKMYEVKDFPEAFHNDWNATEKDNSVVSQRIAEKISMKPQWYKYKGIPNVT